MPKITIRKDEKGQVLVILAVSLMVLLIFIGLAIDGTQLFLNYTRLKRAVDAAAIAAANDFKRGSSIDRMTSAALEILNLHQVDTAIVNFKIYMCDGNTTPPGYFPPDGVRDAFLQTEVPQFYAMCPASGLQKKLIYIRAYENSPTYFVQLVGIPSVPISTTAISEAAPVDLVIVLDTSESMGSASTGYDPGDFNPADCNTNNSCHPLREAKDAAKFLIRTLYPGYDRVAIVTFDSIAITRFSFTGADNGDVLNAYNAVDSRVVLHDDPPSSKLFVYPHNGGAWGLVNPVNPEDRDNNGADDDHVPPLTQCTMSVTPGSYGWDGDYAAGKPCDDLNTTDAFDWDLDGDYDFIAGTDCNIRPATTENCASVQWEQDHTPSGMPLNPSGSLLPMSLVSTCSGCGIREATANLVGAGRSNAVWVMVFLSDGLANMTDTPQTYPYNAGTQKGIPALYPNGFCGGSLNLASKVDGVNYWQTGCIKPVTNIKRYCINADPDTCPHSYAPTGSPGHTVVALADAASRDINGNPYIPPFSPPYGPEDYARDMTDAAALRASDNTDEKPGSDIAIYSIGFQSGLDDTVILKGEPLLRYMAAVGEDGDRRTDPCLSTAVKTSCGQYYFARTTSDLMAVFQDIASRIYTKISE